MQHFFCIIANINNFTNKNIKDVFIYGQLFRLFIDFAKNCSKTQKKSFKKSEIITTYIAKRNQFCLLLSGEANLIRYDFNGNRTIVEHFSTGAIFGEIFYTVNTNNELFVEAKKKIVQ